MGIWKKPRFFKRREPSPSKPSRSSRILARVKKIPPRVKLGIRVGITIAFLTATIANHRAYTKRQAPIQLAQVIAHQVESNATEKLRALIPASTREKLLSATNSKEMAEIVKTELPDADLQKINKIIKEEVRTNPVLKGQGLEQFLAPYFFGTVVGFVIGYLVKRKRVQAK